MSYFIGIDIGASFIKGALFNIDKLEISDITKYPSPQPKVFSKQPPFLRFETNPDLYEELTKKLINTYLKAFRNIEGIVFSAQMHGMILVNLKLIPITPFIGWQDERLLEKPSVKSKTWIELTHNRLKRINTSSTGIKLKSGLMGSTLFWLKENNILQKHKKAKAMFLGDYVAMKLSNGKAFVDITNACSSGIFDVNKKGWNINILNALGINNSYLSEVVPLGTPIGYKKFLNKQVPLFVSVGDLQSAVLGSLAGVINKNTVNINIGTGSQVSFVSSKFNKGNYDIRSYFDNEYLHTITHIPAGRALNVLIKFIENIGYKIFDVNQKIDLWAKIDNLLKNSEKGNGLKADITFFKNNFTEITKGSFTNITEDNWTLENMFVSSLENMAENYQIAYKKLRGNKHYDRIIFSGGLARKLPLLRSLIKNRLKKETNLAPYKEETLTGLFIIALSIKRGLKKVKEASLYCKKYGITYK